ncbi:MAG: CDP-alcohol phosphatidyltransferase family protein [Holosporales bacterium]|jgi:cardiolipin synthase|nr:CDP-alcohol phosphatidyltransferase family protein [Holosporales bacterium]
MSLSVLPNLLSLSRLIGAGVLPFLSHIPRVAFFFFFLVSVSDFFDGWIARKFGNTSIVGKCLDPIADKCLVGSVYILLFLTNIVPFWLVILVITRDIGIVCGAIYLWFRHETRSFVGPILLSKVNTFVQLGYAGFMLGNAAEVWHIALPHGICVVAVLTAASWLSYLEIFWQRQKYT